LYQPNLVYLFILVIFRQHLEVCALIRAALGLAVATNIGMHIMEYFRMRIQKSEFFLILGFEINLD